MKVMWVGKFQPLNCADKQTIDDDLLRGVQVVLAVRDTPLDEENPLTLLQRMDILRAIYPDKVNVIIIPIPDIDLVEPMWESLPGTVIPLPTEVEEMVKKIQEDLTHPEIQAKE